jgi:signal transduction histidine kinase
MSWLRRYAAELAVTLTVVAGTLFTVLSDGAEPGRHVVAGWVLTAACCTAVFLRRRFPLGVAGFALVCCALYYPLTDPDGLILLAFAYTLCTAAAAGRIRGAALLVVAAMAGVAAGEIGSRTGRHVDNFAFFLMTGWFVALVAGGAVAHYRAEAERSKEAEARARATEERLRIARELHDALGHHLALINVQAGAALHRRDPAQAEEALGTIKEASKTALQELRATLGVLRQAGGPALSRVADLTAAAGAAGLTVRTEIDGVARDLPPDVEHAAFRVVQEALTNVAKHAAAKTVVVRLGYGSDELSVQVDDDGRGGDAPPGHGIRGMTERVRALGGDVTAAPREGGGYRVRARLPVR